MKSKFCSKLFVLLCLVSITFTACVGVKLPKSYTVTPNPLQLVDDKVTVKIETEIPKKSFNKKADMAFTPVLKYGDKQKEFQTAYFKGEKSSKEGQVVACSSPTKVNYSAVIPFEEGMENSILVVEPVVHKGKKELKQEEIFLATGVITTFAKISHDEHLLYANRETAAALGLDVNEYYEEVTMVSKNLTAYFQVNLDKLDHNLKLNKTHNLNGQTKDIKDFISKGWKIDKIEIKAYASPEGEERFNEGLSERRALTGKKIINEVFKDVTKDKNPEKTYTFDVKALGEDWNGFIDAVSNSSIKDKNLILNVVKSQSSSIQKEKEIRNMTLIYDELKETVLPPLRRVNINVICFEPKRSAEEILSLALNNPSELSSKELLYAGTLTNNKEEREKIYRSYVSFYPEDWKGNVNLGATLIELDKLAESEYFLNKADGAYPNNPITTNDLGVRLAKKGEYAKAKTFYEKAAKLGVDEKHNISLINVLEGKYDEANKVLSTEECNYNAALTEVAKNRLNKASEILSCCKTSDKVDYLKAVVAARNDNKNQVLDNLKNAFAKNSQMIKEAANDAEFLKYRKDADFIKLVK